MVAAGSRAWQQWLGACLLWWCLVLASLEGGGVTAAADGTSASGERRAGADAGVEAGNAGTEEEDAAVFDMFADTNNVHGLVGTSDHVHYLGMQDTRDACAFPSVRFFLSRSRAAANYLAAFLHTPLTMHPAGVRCTRTRDMCARAQSHCTCAHAHTRGAAAARSKWAPLCGIPWTLPVASGEDSALDAAMPSTSGTLKSRKVPFFRPLFNALRQPRSYARTLTRPWMACMCACTPRHVRPHG